MIDVHSPFGHDLFKVPIRHGAADIKKHGEKDDLLRKLSAFE